MRKLEDLEFDNTYVRLPEEFYRRVLPTPFKNPRLVSFNPEAASLVGLDPSEALTEEFKRYFSGNGLLPGSDPIAMYYTGHQFGVYNPDIGDGRAILLGEVRGPDGRKWDLHLKGAGRTAYSRVFDGRAVLRSAIREYLCSEAMHSLGIPTTRALCIIGSDERVERETAETGAMMVRMAETHVRFGSFEAFYYTDRPDCVKVLADYVIEHHFPGLAGAGAGYLGLLSEVTDRTARLTALWQASGFVHGVMNTDNMSITGLTIDYGPYGFMEEYDPEYTPNHSDSLGRYSYENQPGIAFWNLGKLAQALSPLVGRERAAEALGAFRTLYSRYYLELMRAKLGLGTLREGDAGLIKRLMRILRDDGLDFTNFFRSLSGGRENGNISGGSPELTGWLRDYSGRLSEEDMDEDERKALMDGVNPKYVLRNYLAERAIRKAVDEHDYTEITRLHKLLENPYDEIPGHEDYARPAPGSERNLVISCSS